MQQETAYLWQLALKKAITEADPRVVATKIEKAELALFRRIFTFAPRPNALEAQAIFDALSTIRGLKARCRRHPLRINDDDWMECPSCKATGSEGAARCTQCEGAGWLFVRGIPELLRPVPKRDTFEVNASRLLLAPQPQRQTVAVPPLPPGHTPE